VPAVRPSHGTGGVAQTTSSIVVSSCQDWFYKGSMACVSERRRPNTANPEDLVRRRYVVGKADQTSSNVKAQVSNR
jgi:hypothetical protein